MPLKHIIIRSDIFLNILKAKPDMESNNPNISETEKQLNSFIRFLELVEIPRFRKNFRYILFHYLMTEHEELMPDFEWFIEDMRFFFEFLDELEPGEIEPPA